MATTAQALPSHEIDAPPDTMDLHSDSGFEFGDGDIELDLEPTPAPNQRDDDDLSLRDAGTDGELDVQTAPADHDDFMADNNDLIVEDEIDYGDEEVVNAADPLHTSPVLQQETNAVPDEELIDYSDDEDQQQQQDGNDPSVFFHQAETHVGHPTYETEDVQETHSDTYNNTGGIRHTPQKDQEQNEPGQDANQSVDYSTHEDPRENWRHTNTDFPDVHEDGHYPEHDTHQNQHESYPDGDEDHQGDQLDADTNSAKEYDETHEAHEAFNNANDSSLGEDIHTGNSDHANGLPDMRPVTVNYDGSELWLFKSHDSEGGGEWLLEDDTLAHQPICNLFQACRISLGEDVTDEIELGIRFDHLHNMELYEDNTVCVCTNLAQMVSLYHRLHEQDGNASPECFYMTLQFRPRFSTLLGELRKAAEEGIGHSGLSTAIRTGQTSFNSFHSNEPTEHGYENWKDEEQAVEHQNEHGDSHVENQEQNEEQDEEHYEITEVEEAPEHEEGYSQDGSNVSETSTNNNGSTKHEDSSPHGGLPETQAGPDTTAARARSESAPATESQENEDDLIDYSDDEGPTDNAEKSQPAASQLSSSSSTVQGDDAYTNNNAVEDLTNPTEYVEASGQAQYRYDNDVEEGNPTEYGDSVNLDNQEFEDQERGDEYFQQYDQGFGQEEAVQAPDLELYPPEAEDTTGYYDNDIQHQSENQQDEFALSTGGDGDEHQNDDPTDVDGEFAGVDDFLDLDNEAEAATPEESGLVLPEDAVDNLPEEDAIDCNHEDSADELAQATATSAAKPVAASLAELIDLSPQGQKRSIDEVGNGVGEATDATDVKRPKL